MSNAASLPNFRVADLSSLSLAGSGKRRPIRVPADDRSAGFEAAYDFDTLWYDAVRIGDRVHLVCPRLYTLRPLLDRLTADGHRIGAVGVRGFRRHDLACLRVPQKAAKIGLRIGSWSAESGISADQAALFAGLNAALHMNRNNRLNWFADWARFHIAEHGLEAMLILDNCSTDYPPHAILDHLSGTGLKRAVVLKVPQPYGPTRRKHGRRGGKFLQPAMLNLARLRFLRQARAVLNADLDELVWSRGGSVFDAAMRHPLGLVMFKGAWRMPPPRTQAPFAHAQHVHLREGEWPCPTKYCIRPDGPLGWAGWDVHRLESVVPIALPPRRDIGYWHCRGVTTDWKGYGRLDPANIGAKDASTAAILARVFS
ncbi:MAG: hypothetical protein AAF865_06105 [Pseudomonadota bacterium]